MESLTGSGYPTPDLWRCSPITTPQINYDKLNIPASSVSRSEKYTRYLPNGKMLRTHTSAIAAEIVPSAQGEKLLIMSGITYRRDVKDKTHVGEPHQADIWLVSEERELDRSDLEKLISTILEGLELRLPYRLNETSHPYTHDGVEIEVLHNGQWLEIGEAGIAHQSLLQPNHSGLAMGMGLERLAMLIKNIDDIRLLYSDSTKDQMQNLDPYIPVNRQPVIVQDISIKASQDAEIEDITERIALILGEESEVIQSIEIIAKTGYKDLPVQAIRRLNLQEDECNLLVRLTIQGIGVRIDRTESNKIRDKILKALGDKTEMKLLDIIPG
jgi:phenylalanyl-tRNA synthetase alpha chain